MKRLLLLVLGMCLFLGACDSVKELMNSSDSASAQAPAGSKEATVQDLAGKQFMLVSVGGNDISSKKLPLEFSDTMNVSAMGCNRIVGLGELKEGVLSVPRSGATRRMCTEETLNALDATLQRMFTQGAKATLEDNMLKLVLGDEALVYKQL